MKELTAAVVESYDETGELKLTAEEFDMSTLKIRKLLITVGAYSNELSDEVNRLFGKGKFVAEIQTITGFGKSSVNGYLPYMKAIYKPKELSLNAEWIGVFRSRQQAVMDLTEDLSDDNLWDAAIVFQKYPFHTATVLPFVYEIKKGWNGEYNRELTVSRRKESETVVWSSVKLAFQKVMELQGEVVNDRKLWEIFGGYFIVCSRKPFMDMLCFNHRETGDSC